MKIPQLYELFKQHPVVCTDSRKIICNAIFFALKGDNFNGNEFARKAIDLGAAYSVVDEKKYATKKNIIYVEDVLETLQQLANYHREQLSIPIIGITGSNGKTTTKELVYAVLSKRYNTLATEGNLNNHIGVPLTLLKITNQHQIAIIEMGANHLNEIDFLCRIAMPNFGVITNIGKAHIEGFGSFEGVIKTKSELYQYIKNCAGKVFVNNDDALLVELASTMTTITYGSSNSACTAKLLSSTPFVQLEWNKNTITSNLYGAYNFPNILAAICIGSYFEVNEHKICAAIAEYTSTNNRSELVKIGSTLIYLDAYNANPSSMNVAIDTFIENKNQNKLMLLGDMLELGSISKQEHQQIIEKVLKTNIKTVFVGKNFGLLASQYQNKRQLCFFENYNLAANWLKAENIKNYNILIKGSRGIQLEKIVELLK